MAQNVLADVALKVGALVYAIRVTATDRSERPGGTDRSASCLFTKLEPVRPRNLTLLKRMEVCKLAEREAVRSIDVLHSAMLPL